MLKKHYEVERTGQMDFFDNYGIDYQGDNSILVDDTDGIYRGNILEFKLNISDLNKVLFQVVKYLSHMRVRGESVPARILLIDLNATKVYVYKSINYLNDIEKIYTGGASINDAGFAGNNTPDETLDYSDMVDSDTLKNYLLKTPEKDWYTPVHIDENDIVGWAERYYREVPKATKGDFLGDDSGQVKITGEIRDPKHFKGLIYPYTEKTNEKFKYLMDMLNDRLNKKDLGAFYTPEPYAKKAAELVQKAVEQVPDGNDYVIIDRCAGTGNLEAPLVDMYDKNGDSLISHVIVSTYEYYEYKVLQERIGDKVRNIIPPTEANVEYANGKVANADAMSEDFINNPLIKQYLDNDKCTIILFENPPYRDISSDVFKTKQSNYVKTEMQKASLKGALLNELTNRFIWSGITYYLRQTTDSYILFSPVKYFKRYDFFNLTYRDGYLFNRKYFHATPAGISCIWWQNKIKDISTQNIILKAYDIQKSNLAQENTITIKKVHKLFSKVLYDHRSDSKDTDNGIWCNMDGTERLNPKGCRIKPLFNKNIIAYEQVASYNFRPTHRQLLRCGEYDGNGFFVRRDNYLEKLPLWVAKLIPLDDWYDKEIYATTADGGTAYTKDKDFLKQCLLYTVLSNQNKCLTFIGSDKRFYQNELCLDDTNFTPQAKKDLDQMTLTNDEQTLVDLFDKILKEAKQTKNYKSNYTYGVYQITKELNTFHFEGTGTRKKKVYDDPTLNGDLNTLRTKLKQYYLDHIKANMFKYELVK